MPKQVDHLQVAKNNLTIPNGITPEQYSIRVATAQAAATVALVEAQETANLIAFYNMSPDDSIALIEKGIMTSEKFETIARNIVDRLGLS